MSNQKNHIIEKVLLSLGNMFKLMDKKIITILCLKITLIRTNWDILIAIFIYFNFTLASRALHYTTIQNVEAQLVER